MSGVRAWQVRNHAAFAHMARVCSMDAVNARAFAVYVTRRWGGTLRAGMDHRSFMPNFWHKTVDMAEVCCGGGGEGSALWLDREGPRRANYAQNSSKQKINIFILFTIKFYEQIFSPILFRAFAYLITFVCASATSYQRNSAYDV